MDFQNAWYQNKVVWWPLIPLSILYRWGVKFRKMLYSTGVFPQEKFPIPIIIVGNITVGGTGKTPLVIYVAELLKSHGFKPGIVSRGYKGEHREPTIVTSKSDPKQVGDEAVVVVKRTHCAMVVGKNRSLAIKKLLKEYAVDVVISDDGLQHYAISRQIEIAVVDGNRRFGNEYCLPVGPLREPKNRLDQVNLIVINNGKTKANEHAMRYDPGLLYHALNPTQEQTLDTWKGKKVHAVTGLGNPKQFFDLLKNYGLEVIPHAYPDHYFFKSQDVVFADHLPIIMTEKDAVKCTAFFGEHHWILPIKAAVSPMFNAQLLTLLKG